MRGVRLFWNSIFFFMKFDQKSFWTCYAVNNSNKICFWCTLIWTESIICDWFFSVTANKGTASISPEDFVKWNYPNMLSKRVHSSLWHQNKDVNFRQGFHAKKSPPQLMWHRSVHCISGECDITGRLKWKCPLSLCGVSIEQLSSLYDFLLGSL